MNKLLIDLANESDMQFKLAVVPADIVNNFAKAIIRECLAANHAAIGNLKDEGMDGIPGFNTILRLVEVNCKSAICEKFGVELWELPKGITNE